MFGTVWLLGQLHVNRCCLENCDYWASYTKTDNVWDSVTIGPATRKQIMFGTVWLLGQLHVNRQCSGQCDYWASYSVCVQMSDITVYYTVPKEIHFPRYNMKCSGDNVILRGIVNVVSGFHPHFMFYRGNLDCFSNRVALNVYLETLVKPV